MEYRELGSTGLRVSAVAFGAGPISGLMVGESVDRQRETVRRALDVGINWFDTAATYGDGQSERSLGAALRAAGGDREAIHVATKVRLLATQLGDIRKGVEESFAASLERLGLDRVTLIQLHNSVTERRDDLPTSVTPEDVLRKGGVLAAFEELRARGLVDHFGFTGLGDRRSLDALIRDGRFATVQVPYSILTPISGADRSAGSKDVDYEALLDDCRDHGIGAIAIRVFAGGALTGQSPSQHTYKTKFFPLDLFRRDAERCSRVAARLPGGVTLEEATVRFVLGHASVATALIGFAAPDQIDAARRFAAAGPLDAAVVSSITDLGDSEPPGVERT